MRADDLFGTAVPAAFHSTPVRNAAIAREDMLLPNSQLYYCLFEIPMAVALAHLPPSVHPSVPALMGVTFYNVEKSPVGPFEVALIGVGCRTGIKPRHFIVSAFASTAAAVEYLREQHGFPCRLANVQLRESYDRISGRVLDGERAILDIETLHLLPIVGANSFVKVSPPVNPVKLEKGAIELLQFEASYDFKRVLRGKPRVHAFNATALGCPKLEPVYPISGAHAIIDLTIHPPRYFLPTDRPIEVAGVRKVAS